MQPLVRELYKRILAVGRDYPAGLAAVRRRAKREFFERRDLRDAAEVKKAVGYGRYMIREMTGVIQLKKYRTLRSRYGAPDAEDELADLFRRGRDAGRGRDG